MLREEIDAWIIVYLGQCSARVYVHMSDAARAYVEKTAPTSIRISFPEFLAWSRAVDAVTDGRERHARLVEGLRYFAQRSGAPDPHLYSRDGKLQ